MRLSYRALLLAVAAAALAFPAAAPAHLHPFNAAAECAPADTGAGNEAAAFFFAPGFAHWEIVDLMPGVPGVQFLIQLSNPGNADVSQGAIAVPGIFTGNPGREVAVLNCTMH